ncbi:hypothetical protein Tco_0824539 [Tanacetum coccineum]|uniref:Zinc finger, CCHC-type n=1 Tax=Tanacetum coccineum TaxID=301880 RepID=A0ABQ5AL13_9ASTR
MNPHVALMPIVGSHGFLGLDIELDLFDDVAVDVVEVGKFDESGKRVIICLYVDDMLIFGADQDQVDLTNEFLSSSTPMDTSEKLKPNTDKVVSQLEYSMVIGCLIYVMTCTRHDIAFVVGKRILVGYTDVRWINNTEDNSLTSGWVFLLGGGLATTGKEAEWLKNMILDILLWSKPIALISTRCDSAATLAKAYSQMYTRKSRHLGVRHSMIHKLITNGVISI